VDVLAYHRYATTEGLLGPAGLLLTAGAGMGASAAANEPERGHVDPSMRRQLLKDGWSPEKISAVFG